MLNNEAVGIYGAATRLSESWYFLPVIIVGSVFPAILEAKRNNEALYYRRLQRLYDLMVILAVAGAGAFAITFLAEWPVTKLFGEVYEQAATILAIHVWASVLGYQPGCQVAEG
jgi:O-antigen/teichoic acid export membrane protein